MALIEINVDETILKEAEKALFLIGMDVQIAVNIFLRRIAIEKGFPLSMTTPVSVQKESIVEQVEEKEEEFMSQTRNNVAISKKMVEEVWQAFLRYLKGLGTINRLSDDVAESSGMNRGSAFIYLNILVNLVKGTPNTRALKMDDLEIYMDKIKSELGPNEYANAVRSLKASVPYWKEKLPSSFAYHVEQKLSTIWIIQ